MDTATAVKESMGRPDAVVLNIGVENLGKNPYRDINCFPIDETKIESLVESISTTGYWPSIMARPLDNIVDGKVVTQAELEAMISSGEHDFSKQKWEIPFGHHRLVAFKTFDWASIPTIIRVLTNEEMLIMMANENKEGYGNNVLATLETVREVNKKILETLESETYALYVAAGNSLFKDEKTFLAAKGKGKVSWKRVMAFLGSTWKQAQVRAPFNALSAINKGFIEAQDYSAIKSLTHAENISGMICFIYEGGKDAEGKEDPTVKAPEWPLVCKKAIVKACIEKCSQGEQSKNVAAIKAAYKQLRLTGTSPATHLRSPSSVKIFDPYEVASDLLLDRPKETKHATEKDAEGKAVIVAPDYDGIYQKNLVIIQGVADDSEWAEYDKLEDMILKLKSLAEKRSKAVAKKVVDAPPADDGGDEINKGPETPGDTIPGDTIPGGEIAVDPTLPKVVLENFAESAQTMQESIASLLANPTAMEALVSHPLAVKELSISLKSMFVLVLKAFPDGGQRVSQLYDAVRKELTEPTPEDAPEPVETQTEDGEVVTD